VDVVHVLPEPEPLGGAERAVLDLLSSPALEGLEQRVVFAGRTANRAFPPERVLPVTPSLPSPLSAALAASRVRPRVLHGWLLRGNAAAALAALLSPGSRLVTSERNLGHNMTRAKALVERASAQAETVAIANSRAVVEAAAVRAPRRRGHFRVIETGVVPPSLASSPLRSSCAMVGRLHWIKDYPLALRAFAQVAKNLPDATLVVVGEGPERRALEGLVAQLGLSHRVTLVGTADPAPYLLGAQLFLSTSRSEGLQRAMLEALSAGLPVVTTEEGGQSGLESAAVRLVRERTPEAVADAVQELLGDERTRCAAARAAEALHRARFTRDRSDAEYLDLYRSLGC